PGRRRRVPPLSRGGPLEKRSEGRKPQRPRGRQQVHAVGSLEVAGGTAFDIGVPVLPDDAAAMDADQDDPLPIVVGNTDQAWADPDGERWVVEHPRAG